MLIKDFSIFISCGHFDDGIEAIKAISEEGHPKNMPGRVAQSVGHLTRKSGVLGSISGLATYFRFSFRFIKKGSCPLLAKVCDVHEVLVNRLGGLSLPRKSVVRLTDRPDRP